MGPRAKFTISAILSASTDAFRVFVLILTLCRVAEIDCEFDRHFVYRIRKRLRRRSSRHARQATLAHASFRSGIEGSVEVVYGRDRDAGGLGPRPADRF